MAEHGASDTKPINSVIQGVRPAQLTGGKVYTAIICPDAEGELFPYVDARVLAVVATVDGVDTDGGKYN